MSNLKMVLKVTFDDEERSHGDSTGGPFIACSGSAVKGLNNAGWRWKELRVQFLKRTRSHNRLIVSQTLPPQGRFSGRHKRFGDHRGQHRSASFDLVSGL